MLLDARKGEALLAVLESGSFEQAALQLHLTPSAISQRLKALETELGTPLLLRSRPCRPTPAGQRLALYLRRSRLLEDEFIAEFNQPQQGLLTVPIAVNNDTLATWLLPALADFLRDKQLLLDLTVDDQDHTHTLLESGQALAGISSQAQALRGGEVHALGQMRYRLLASPAFVARWFPKGLQREAARSAPLMVFNRKDALQADFLAQHLGLPAGSYPCHYVPASEPFLRAIQLGLGYGMVPELQFDPAQHPGELVELAPQQPVDVPLFWHHWRVQPPRLEQLSKAVRQAATQHLRQAGHIK